MRYTGIKKIHEGSYITRYDITYETSDNKKKIYEMISRNKNIKGYEELVNPEVDAVVLIMHDETGEKILLNREFRMASGRYIYNFPAGLIDSGENYEESARRELREETGLNLISIDNVMNKSYSAVGFSNETNICVIGTAGGTFAPSDSTYEEIEAAWYTREEVSRLLREEYFAARTQAYCYMWVLQ